jgi:hypothetical protein
MIRQRTVSIAVLSALTAACGGKNSDVVVITVEADPPGIADIAQLVVSASDGARRAEVTVGDLKMLTIPPAKTIGLSVPSGSPTVVIQVEAVNAMGRSMAFGEATVAMASDGATARVKLEAVASPPPRFSTSADIVAATAGTRLRPIGWAPALASDGPTITVGLTDTTLNFDCLWQVATDGKIRCLPGAYQGAIAYADSQCSQTVLVTTASRCNPAADAGAYGTLFNFNTCRVAGRGDSDCGGQRSDRPRDARGRGWCEAVLWLAQRGYEGGLQRRHRRRWQGALPPHTNRDRRHLLDGRNLHAARGAHPEVDVHG